jgi:hypothetical protein
MFVPLYIYDVTLPPQNTDLLQKLISAQMFKKFPAFYENKVF